jgi:hypothetical protein
MSKQNKGKSKSSDGEYSQSQSQNGDRERKGGCGVISRVLTALARRFSVDKALIITGFVLGFVFAPVLATLTFVGAWIWSGDEERYERLGGQAVRGVQRAWRAAFGGSAGHTPGDPMEDPPARHPVDFPELRREFEDLEQRAAGMEKFVTSEERALEREFRNMNTPR